MERDILADSERDSIFYSNGPWPFAPLVETKPGSPERYARLAAMTPQEIDMIRLMLNVCAARKKVQ